MNYLKAMKNTFHSKQQSLSTNANTHKSSVCNIKWQRIVMIFSIDEYTKLCADNNKLRSSIQTNN